MGQQQLLLILVAVIITGIAIAVGITLFKANAAGQNRDAVWTDLNALGSRAQEYYRKPRALGGGDDSFIGFKISGKESENDNGVYNVVGSPSATQVKILGVGRELGENESDLVTLNLIVQPDTMYIDPNTMN